MTTARHQRTAFLVRGLDCGEEVLLLRRVLEGQPGIVELEFDVLNAGMVVGFDDQQTSPQTIIERVSRIGLQARIRQKHQQSETEPWWPKHRRTVLTAASVLTLLTGFVTHAAIEGSVLGALAHDSISGPSPPGASVAAYGVAILAGMWFVVPKAWAALRLLRPDMNLLMSIAVVGAIFIGEWFEAATVAFLFSLALLLEQWSLGRTRRAVRALMSLTPATARCVCPCHGDIEERPVDQVAVGSRVAVRPGEKVPLDGRVLTGQSSVNEAPITGESIPVPKAPGDAVFAGTINLEAAIELEVTKFSDDTTLARIVHMVQDAQSRRAPVEQWVETFARRYTPFMMALAVLVAVVSPPLFSIAWSEGLYRGLVLLVIACPCALVISTPVSIVCGLASAARHGVLVKGGRSLEAMARVRALALDKTGTLTYGRPAVQQVVPFNGHTTREVLQRAAAMEIHSQHPLGCAILTKAEEEGVAVEQSEGFRLLGGKGAEATLAGRAFWIGSHRLMHEKGAETPEIHARAVALEDAGHSVVAVGNDNHVCGLISVADAVRDGAAANIAKLKAIGVRHVVMLTGDNEETAREVARLVGIDDYRSEMLPEDKVLQVERLKEQYGTVAMIGDGVNDAPAMAAATVGVAMGVVGTDTAIETADVALMSDDLSKVPWLISHARRTLSTIQQNVVFALGLKLAFIGLTLYGVGWLSLWIAIAADTGASLLVISNGLRLLKA